MPINVNNREADVLTRKFAQMEGVGITDAIVLAMKEAIARRRANETPVEAAARLRADYGIKLSVTARKVLPRTVYDSFSDEMDTSVSSQAES